MCSPRSDWLKTKGYQDGSIGMIGLSLGAASSIGATVADPAVGALVIDSCFAELMPIVEAKWVEESGLPQVFLVSTRLMVRLLYGWDMGSVNPVEELGRVAPRPLLVIHCQDDQEIPISHFERLKASAPSAETWVLPHCIHGQTYGADPAAFEARVDRILRRQHQVICPAKKNRGCIPIARSCSRESRPCPACLQQ